VLSAGREELEAVPGIGPKVAEAVSDFLESPGTRRIIEELRERGLKLLEADASGAAEFVGLTFVFTGALESMSRSAAEDLVRSQGGRTSSSVSAKTDYLVAGSDPGSKHAKALELGVTILSEAEFLKMLPPGAR
jgi:DNA ligase (NAD+)